MKQQVPTQEALEANLRQYGLASAPAELRGRILEIAAAPKKIPPMEFALRGALTLLVAVLIWAEWMERGTADRMARVAAASIADQDPQYEHPHGQETSQGLGWIELAMLHPRASLPLPPGQTTTRITINLSSISATSIGETP